MSIVPARAGYSCGLALLFFLFGSKALQNAVAEGDTRTISMHHIHTDEDITITYKRDGRYDEAALEKLNWFLRDWRRNEETRMDPHLIDLVWEVQRETGSKQADPGRLRLSFAARPTPCSAAAATGVARFSQHMLGHAMDFYIPGVPLEELRVIGLRLQRGGVGFYPTSGSPFVHMDTGGMRMWPRMTRKELVRVFPDGRTVHIPTDGRPLPGYALALADIRKRGGTPSANVEAARNAGVDVDALVASNERRAAIRSPSSWAWRRTRMTTTRNRSERCAERPVPSVKPPPRARPPKRPVLAAIEHGAQVAEKATVAAAVKVADAARR